MNYLVEWAIEIEADSPQEAAEKALETQRNPESIATVFTVTDDDKNCTTVDLDEGNV